MSLRNTPVSEAMIPINKAVCAPESARVEDFMHLARGPNISRVAIYRDSPVHIVGLVHVFDLMDPSVRPTDSLKPLVRPAPQIAFNATIQNALYELQRDKQPMAIVVDNDGQTAGLLSLEDLARYVTRRDPQKS